MHYKDPNIVFSIVAIALSVCLDLLILNVPFESLASFVYILILNVLFVFFRHSCIGKKLIEGTDLQLKSNYHESLQCN